MGPWPSIVSKDNCELLTRYSLGCVRCVTNTEETSLEPGLGPDRVSKNHLKLIEYTDCGGNVRWPRIDDCDGAVLAQNFPVTLATRKDGELEAVSVEIIFWVSTPPDSPSN